MPARRPQDLIRPEIQSLAAYHVQPASGMIKLDAMENPYHLPEAMRDLVADLAHDAALNRYPDAGATELKAALRHAMKIPAEAGISLGNGSDELIQMLALGMSRPGATLLALEPAFVMYRMIARFVDMNYVGVPLRADFTLDRDAWLAAIEREQPALIFLAYPNNPTGNLFAAEDIEATLRAASGLVVVDEAYTPFAGGASFMPRLAEFPNLIVMRTVSKLGLAGLRLGYMVGAEEWIAEFEKLRLPYNINVLTQLVATRVLDRVEVLDAQAQSLVAERARLYTEMRAVAGVEVFESQANFLLFRVADANWVHNGLKSRYILIKNLHGSHPLLDNCLRVTVGTPAENDAFLNVLSEYL